MCALAVLIHRITQAVEQGFGSAGAVIAGDGVPGCGLSALHPCQLIIGRHGSWPVIPGGVSPATGGKVLANVGLEVDLFVRTHADTSPSEPANASSPLGEMPLPISSVLQISSGSSAVFIL